MQASEEAKVPTERKVYNFDEAKGLCRGNTIRSSLYLKKQGLLTPSDRDAIQLNISCFPRRERAILQILRHMAIGNSNVMKAFCITTLPVFLTNGY